MPVCLAMHRDLEEDNRSIVGAWAGLGWAGLGFRTADFSTRILLYGVSVASVTSEDHHLILPEEGGSTFRPSTRLHGITP